MADLEHGIRNSADTVFEAGSVSKQFTAAAALALVDAGKLKLDTDVRTIIPELPDYGQVITIDQLLNHTSGLVREAPGFDGDKVQSDIDVIRSAYATPLNAPPGTRFEYCNLGYFILAEIITRTSGTPWPTFFAERVFGPAGMTATRPTSLTELIPHRARGYAWNAGRFENALSFRALRPSGAFTSTATDLAIWEGILARGGFAGSAVRAEMWQPARLANGEAAPYGFGWRIEPVEGHTEIGHGGSLPGFRAYYARYPHAKLAIIVLTNNGAAEPRDIARGIARTMFRRGG